MNKKGNINFPMLITVTVLILVLGVVAMVSEKINTDISEQINTSEATTIKSDVHDAFTNITSNLSLVTLVLVFMIIVGLIMGFMALTRGGGAAL